MKRRRINLSGLQYLDAVTDLLQRARLEDPSAGLYEAADLQWWWREHDASHSDRQTFWCDADGTSVACLLCFDSGDEWNNDLFCLPSVQGIARAETWPVIVDKICTSDKPSTMTVRDDDVEFQSMLEQVGFQPDATAMIQTYLCENPSEASLRTGFRLETRAQNDRLPHHMIHWNGSNIGKKLMECSLYRPELDLVIRDAKNTVAAYGLFWMDLATHVGLIEPVRTVESFQRAGLAKYLISEGILRLREMGAEIIKVTYKANNEAAARLYHHAGFRDQFRKLEYRRTPSQHGAAADVATQHR